MDRFICSLSGNCEPDDSRGIPYSECSNTCQGVEAKDLYFLQGEHYPLMGLEWALPDRIELIRRITGVRLQGEYAVHSREVLFYLTYEKYVQLLTFPPLYEWLRQHFVKRPSLEEVEELDERRILSSGIPSAIEYFGAPLFPLYVLRNGARLEDVQWMLGQDLPEHRRTFIVDWIGAYCHDIEILQWVRDNNLMTHSSMVEAVKHENIQWLKLYPGRIPIVRGAIGIAFYLETGTTPNVFPANAELSGDEELTELRLQQRLADFGYEDLPKGLDATNNGAVIRVVLKEIPNGFDLNLHPLELPHPGLSPEEEHDITVYIALKLYRRMSRYDWLLDRIKREVEPGEYIRILSKAGTLEAHRRFKELVEDIAPYINDLVSSALDYSNLPLLQLIAHDVEPRHLNYIQAMATSIDYESITWLWNQAVLAGQSLKLFPSPFRPFSPALERWLFEEGHATDQMYKGWTFGGYSNLVERGGRIPSLRDMLESRNPADPRYLRWMSEGNYTFDEIADALEYCTHPVVLDVLLGRIL